ncbi:MAG: hypoxanthine phosphoribosyltransferase [Oscillospiraceae bacterium]|nr:hypoxanthine phosphoribosyltransferase [Oscillospiraceae bacterium]
MHQDIEKILIDERTLKKRVCELADEIRRDAGQPEPLLVGVLKGSFIFMADLLRALDMYCEIDFMAVSSYGANTVNTGQVRILKDIGQSIENRDVILVEDILDSGETLGYIMRLMKARQPRSLKLCVMLDKPERRKVDITPDYVGFSIPNEFVVGYGLDYAERYRQLPYIGVLKPEIYK